MERYVLTHYYGSHYRLACFKQGIPREKNKKIYSEKAHSLEVERISLSRTKREIKEIALCNNFSHFATITINSQNCDRYSLTDCQKLLKKKLQKIKRINKNFAYIFITEKHKDGAFHFHGLVRDIGDFYINKNGYKSNKILDEIGFNSFSEIKDYFKCCNYILKYVTKDCVRNDANQIYIRSRGLKFASREEINPVGIEDLISDDDTALKRLFKSNYCVALDFDTSNLSHRGKTIFASIIPRKYTRRPIGW